MGGRTVTETCIVEDILASTSNHPEMQLLGILLTVCAAAASAAPLRQNTVSIPSRFSRVVVFGDSLVDNGNGTWELTNHTWPGDKAYFNGRFSNGPTWVERLADKLGVPCVSDVAFGGATLNNTRAQGYTGYDSNISVPDVIGQVHAHLDKYGADPNALYIVSGGSNDLYFGLQKAANVTEFGRAIASDIEFANKVLVRAGARHIAVPTLIQSNKSPYGVRLDKKMHALQVQCIDSFNEALKCDMSRNITVIDLHAVADEIYGCPERYGIHVMSEACLQGTLKPEKGPRRECRHPERYAYWDLYHPTARMHELLAQGAVHVFK